MRPDEQGPLDAALVASAQAIADLDAAQALARNLFFLQADAEPRGWTSQHQKLCGRTDPATRLMAAPARLKGSLAATLPRTIRDMTYLRQHARSIAGPYVLGQVQAPHRNLVHPERRGFYPRNTR